MPSKTRPQNHTLSFLLSKLSSRHIHRDQRVKELKSPIGSLLGDGRDLYRSHDNALGLNSGNAFHDRVVTLETNKLYALNFYNRPNYLT